LRSLTYDEIDTLWQQKADMELEDAPRLVEELAAAQPSVLNYFLAIGDNLLSNSERQIIFFMGVLIWYVINQLEDTIPEISLDQLLENEEKNLRMLEYLAGEPDGEFLVTVEKIMDTYEQSTLLIYVIERILEEPEKNIEIIDDHVGMMVIYLKSFIDSITTVVS
jgi:hypothetical protein